MWYSVIAVVIVTDYFDHVIVIISAGYAIMIVIKTMLSRNTRNRLYCASIPLALTNDVHLEQT